MPLRAVPPKVTLPALRRWLAGVPPLALALGVSLAAHAVVLSVQFHLPQALANASEKALEVILVNSRHRNAPQKAQARAQANLDGGGNVAQAQRASTPLPPAEHSREGNELVEAQRRVAELEAAQQQLLTQAAAQMTLPRATKTPLDTPPEPATGGADMASSALAMIRLEAQIARQVNEYNQRPRRKFIGARTQEYRFAQYVEDWRQKIERIGNLNYPAAARGKIYGSLVLTVVIRASGELDRVDINRSSGSAVLDAAARRIVELCAPYAAFPASIRADTDLLEITRTWTFTQADRLQSE